MPSKYDIPKLTDIATKRAIEFWSIAKKVYGVHIGKIPDVVMNPRLTAVGGRAFLTEGKVDFSCYLMERNLDNYHVNVIPHELCHIIAWRLYADGGHGYAWKGVMTALGLEPKLYHNMGTMARNKAKGIK